MGFAFCYMRLSDFQLFFLEKTFRFILLFLLFYLLSFGFAEIVFRTNDSVGGTPASENEKVNLQPFAVEAAERRKTRSFILEPDTISIPKLKLQVPLVLAESAGPKEIEKLLEKGAVLYPSFSSAQERMVILGHSAPLHWPRRNYNWIFSDLGNLSRGDEIFLFSGEEQQRYIVRTKKVLSRGENLPPASGDNLLPELVLLSCWPPGKDYKRIAVFAEIAD